MTMGAFPAWCLLETFGGLQGRYVLVVLQTMEEWLLGESADRNR